jgi:hypothetical protein
MTTRAPLLAVFCALVVASGCGDDDGPPSSELKPFTDAAAVRDDVTDSTSTAPAPDTTTAAPAPGPATTVAPEDKRGAALLCLSDEKGLDVRPVGDKGILVGATDNGPRIDFFQSSLEAEGEQFEGRAEGAEQIGAALFYVRDAPEEQLIAIEDCLNDQ